MNATTDTINSKLSVDPDFREIVEMFVSEIPDRVAALSRGLRRATVGRPAPRGSSIEGGRRRLRYPELTTVASQLSTPSTPRKAKKPSRPASTVWWSFAHGSAFSRGPRRANEKDKGLRCSAHSTLFVDRRRNFRRLTSWPPYTELEGTGTGALPRALSTVPPAVKQCVIQSGLPYFSHRRPAFARRRYTLRRPRL